MGLDMKSLLLALLTAGWLGGAAEMEGAKIADYGVFKTSQFECVIGNNAEWGEHRARYNGVFRITRLARNTD